MKYKIPYGNSYQILNTDKPITIIKPNKYKPDKIFFDFEDFDNFLKDKDNLLVIVNDHSRITPTEKILDFIFDRIIKISNLKFIIATGTHPLKDIKKIKKIFGKYYRKISDKILIHNGLKGDFVYLGTTSYKTEVYYNKIITKFDSILTIGGVEPHYFAGFSGGRKSLFPGIAKYHSIEQNHKLALKDDAKILDITSNPVSLDMEEAVQFLQKNIYSVQVVNNDQADILFLSQGNIKKSFYQAVDWAKEYFTVKIKQKQDLVISVVEHPFDRNFYQAHKGLENTKNILNKNGTMILTAKCSEGIGNDNFYKLLKKASTVDNILDFIDKNYKLGYHKTAKILQFIENNNLIMVTDIPKSLFSGINIKIFSHIREAFDFANKKTADNIALVHNSAICVPVIY